MRIPLDPGAAAPLFRQIEAHLRAAVLRGRLPAGARLPSTRSLARDLGVSRLTVEAAYGELVVDGIVEGRAGSGTYVLPPPPPPPRPAASPPWPAWHAEAIARLGDPPPADGPARPSRGAGAIRLDAGTGDPRLFPVEPFRKALQRVLRRGGAAALGYADPGGLPALRETIAELLTAQGLTARPDQVVVTAGSQRGIALVARLLLRPGDAVAVEAPTYGGALELFRAHGLRILGVPTDGQGLRVDALEALLRRRRPRLLYLMPTFQNPTGACLGLARRRHLLEVAARHGLPILEDDFVGDLRFEGTAQAPLKAIDPGGHVVYASTFSKMLMPGLRMGFLVADGPAREGLLRLQSAEELGTSEPVQRALHELVTVGRYRAHLRRAVRHYRRRRDAAVRAVRRHLPGCEAAPPPGGLFLWVRLPAGVRSDDLLPRAADAGARFAPGGRFFPDPEEGAPFFRLGFAALEPGEIEEGVRRIGAAMASIRPGPRRRERTPGERLRRR